MTTEDAQRFTMRVSDVQRRLGVSRQTVHDMTERGELQFVTRSRGRQQWKYFDPQEIDAKAEERGAPPIELA